MRWGFLFLRAPRFLSACGERFLGAGALGPMRAPRLLGARGDIPSGAWELQMAGGAPRAGKAGPAQQALAFVHGGCVWAGRRGL